MLARQNHHHAPTTTTITAIIITTIISIINIIIIITSINISICDMCPRELNRRYGSSGITSFALHPGVIPTGTPPFFPLSCCSDTSHVTRHTSHVTRHTSHDSLSDLGRYSTTANVFYKIGGLFMKSIPQGAATQVPAAHLNCLTTGEFFGRGGIVLPRVERCIMRCQEPFMYPLAVRTIIVTCHRCTVLCVPTPRTVWRGLWTAQPAATSLRTGL